MNISSDILSSIVGVISSPSFEMIQTVGLVYIGLLWLSIIIWVTRDSISRSGSLLFQTFAILLNIIIPILGVLLYLIIRPSQTLLERYYQEMEQRLLQEAIEEKKPKPGKKIKNQANSNI
ncbi:MAG: hypothetical protein V1760_02295 [Candidatus Peregrinibacteria bacterium]